MKYIYDLLEKAITEEVQSRTWRLRTVEKESLEVSQGYINGLDKAMSIINDTFSKIPEM